MTKTRAIKAGVHAGSHTIKPGEGDKVTSLDLSLSAYKKEAMKVLGIVEGMATARVAFRLSRKGLGSFRCVGKLKFIRVAMPVDEGDSPSVSFVASFAEPMVTLAKLQAFLAAFADSHHEDIVLEMDQMQPELPTEGGGE